MPDPNKRKYLYSAPYLGYPGAVPGMVFYSPELLHWAWTTEPRHLNRGAPKAQYASADWGEKSHQYPSHNAAACKIAPCEVWPPARQILLRRVRPRQTSQFWVQRSSPMGSTLMGYPREMNERPRKCDMSRTDCLSACPRWRPKTGPGWRPKTASRQPKTGSRLADPKANTV